LASNPTYAIVRELQQMISEVRGNPNSLKFHRLPNVEHWQDVRIITLGDQAHNNRPKGGSTGGLLTMMGGPAHSKGEPGPLVLLGWKTWKLQRVAIGTTDGEVQAMVESEDQNFRARLIWAELNGATCEHGNDFLKAGEEAVRAVPGIVGTDSKGGYDAVTREEGPNLGLSNARAAIQGHQLKESVKRSGTRLIWLSGEWNISDALTKKGADARASFMQFLKTGIWMLRFDPNFVVSAKKSKARGLDAVGQMKRIDRAQAKKNFGLVRVPCSK
jgi:hypothetical protein